MRDLPFQPRARANGLSIYGAVGLIVSGIVHFGSYIGHTIRPENPLFWLLHVGIFPLFFALVFRMRAWQTSRRGIFGFPRAQLRWRELIAYVPVWVPPLVVLLFAYVMVNFFLATSHLPPRGTALAESPAEAIYTVRAFSGHWLVFYALPTLFFTFVPADARPAPVAQDAAV
jgi:hypothetical protein